MIGKKSIKYMLIAIAVIGLFVFIKASAINENVIAVDSEFCDMVLEEYGPRESGIEIRIDVDNVAPGKKLSTFEYCKYEEDDCDDNSSWHDLNGYADNYISSFANSVGTHDMTFFLMVPNAKQRVRAVFEDFEAMNISYAAFKLSTDDEGKYRDIYVDKARVLGNYENDFTDIVTGYLGGDIILPHGCTDNGCLLKVTMDDADYDSIMARLNAENAREFAEHKEFLEVGQMNNHLSDYNLAGDTLEIYKVNNELYIESNGGTKSFYLIVSKFFYEKNRSDFVVGDNKNRILAEDYLGLNYSVDRKYFDEGNNYGFLSFNDFNDYKQETTIFYGTPVIQFVVDGAIAPALAAGGSAAGMGHLNKVYNNIVSLDNDNYPINNSFELTINSFYNPDYIVPISLKNGNTVVQNIELNLSRFAFGGNAGNVLLVDGDGINCRRLDAHPNCEEGNIYVSTSYRGLYDTFYGTGNSRTIDTYEISHQQQGIVGNANSNRTVYERNQAFNPWAVAIFYHDDEVVATKSFNLGELVKVEGYTEDVITESMINGVAQDFNGNPINDYDSSIYLPANGGDGLFGYGLGYEQPMNKIKYFDESTYHGANIDFPIILASKEDILSNNINRIALFLTNGELKSDEDNFPELTYGVGEGKIFEIDGRVFEELGGN